MAVGSPVIRVPRSGRRIYSGEFTGAGGAVSGIKFKGEVSVTYISAGLYEFQCLENGVAARPGTVSRLAYVNIDVVGLSGATNGGWTKIPIQTDNMNASGKFRAQLNQQSFAAADGIGTIKVEFAIEREAA